MATEPKPLPPIKDDPSVQAGYQIQQQYPRDLEIARGDRSVTDIQRAANVIRLWKDTAQKLADLYADLQNRRVARNDWLEQQIPAGPGIPDDTTPADKTVLLAAFNNALTKAREADAPQRLAMLHDAQRFGDTAAVRAVVTAALDDSQWQVIDPWAQQYAPDTAAHFTEWKAMRTVLAGRAHGQAQEYFALKALDQPQEHYTYQRLIEQHNNEVRQHNGTYPVRVGTAPARKVIEPDPTLL